MTLKAHFDSENLFAINNFWFLFDKPKLVFIVLLIFSPFLAAEKFEKVDVPPLGKISTSTPRQIVKELTRSAYIFESENDFDRDGKMEAIVGANCIEEFCLNFIFENLHNSRVKYIGSAYFHREFYELVWRPGHKWADLVYFKQENVGQGCIGRYEYEPDNGFKKRFELCRLPKEVKQALNSYQVNPPNKQKTTQQEQDLDYIDFSDIEFEDDSDALFPE